MEWAVYALLASLTYVASLEANSAYRADGRTVNAWRSLLATLAITAATPFMEWPDKPAYYLMLVISAVFSIIGMNAQFRLAAKTNGRVANLHTPIMVFVTFFGWLAIDGAEREFLFSHPRQMGLAISAMALLTLSFVLIRRNPVGWSALMAILPVGIQFGLCNILDKLILDQGDSGGMTIVLNMIFLQNLIMTLWFIPTLRKDAASKNLKILKQDPAFKCAIHVATYHTVSWIFIALAFIHTTNPAYPVIITSLSPLWYMIYYRMRGIKDDASPVAGAIMFAAGILVLISNSTAPDLPF